MAHHILVRGLRSGAVAGLLGSLALVAGPVPAAAQEVSKQACTDAYVANQKLRKDGQLVQAREQLLICAQEGCPDAVKSDCVRWLNDLEPNIPTVVVAAKDEAGSDTVAVAVFIDGSKVADELTGRPIAVDPGVHQIRFEHAGSPPIEQRIVIQQGVKNRSLEVSFATPDADIGGQGDGGTTGGPQPPPSPEPEPERPEPVAAYALWGLSLVGFGMFAGFGIVGKREANDLDKTCGENAEPPAKPKSCTDEQIDPVRTKLIVADVSLGVGAAAFVVGTILFIVNRVSDPPSSAWRLDLGPTRGGGYAGLSYSF